MGEGTREGLEMLPLDLDDLQREALKQPELAAQGGEVEGFAEELGFVVLM